MKTSLRAIRLHQYCLATCCVSCLSQGKLFAFMELRSCEETSNATALDGVAWRGSYLKIRCGLCCPQKCFDALCSHSLEGRSDPFCARDVFLHACEQLPSIHLLTHHHSYDNALQHYCKFETPVLLCTTQATCIILEPTLPSCWDVCVFLHPCRRPAHYDAHTAFMLGPTTPDPTMDTSRLDICRTVSSCAFKSYRLEPFSEA